MERFDKRKQVKEVAVIDAVPDVRHYLVNAGRWRSQTGGKNRCSTDQCDVPLTRLWAFAAADAWRTAMSSQCGHNARLSSTVVLAGPELHDRASLGLSQP
ncbi:MAG: hypothetical protein M3486_08150, partial [Actinomycetota bacterium]|nr:hypothetical protein [Actinomycetota bacterium]